MHFRVSAVQQQKQDAFENINLKNNGKTARGCESRV